MTERLKEIVKFTIAKIAADKIDGLASTDVVFKRDELDQEKLAAAIKDRAVRTYDEFSKPEELSVNEIQAVYECESDGVLVDAGGRPVEGERTLFFRNRLPKS